MPKTNKSFDWEIYDENDEFIDILSMTNDEMKQYQNNHSHYNIIKLGYTDDGGDDTWETDRKERGDIYSIRIPKRHRKLEDVYETS